ncbi:protein cappuccino-like [Schistocerca piceifrons]|uniref:protein cappuccino-like n=1 Tax=Schistocerca piceifrons TaxID=274613 RepID=UPI001F5FB3EC|nr:protein cappuccino-like [Schistocerca piceifrons]
METLKGRALSAGRRAKPRSRPAPGPARVCPDTDVGGGWVRLGAASDKTGINASAARKPWLCGAFAPAPPVAGRCTPPPPPPPPPPLLLTPFNGPSWPGAVPLPPPALFAGAAMPPRPTKGGRQVGVAREARAPHSAGAAPLQL